MIFEFESRLFALAAEFTGKYVPFTGVHLAPGPGGDGVVVTSSDRGAICFMGYDPKGTAGGEVTLLPDKEVVKASRGLKLKERTLRIDTDARVARITTHMKSGAGQTVELPAPAPAADHKDLRPILPQFIDVWKTQGDISATAGRYDTVLIRKALDAAESLGASVVLSSLVGGPLRVAIEGTDAMLLIVPQTALPIPALPEWLEAWSATFPEAA